MKLAARLRKQDPQTSAYAQVAFREALRQAGVERMQTGLLDRVCRSETPGVVVRIGRDGKLHIRVAIVVGCGIYLRQAGLSVQDAVRSALGKVADRPIGEVNVRIAGIGLGKTKPRGC